MGIWDSIGGGLIGGLGGAGLGFLTGGPAGALAGGLAGGMSGWSAGDTMSSARDANLQNMQLTREAWARDDTAVQRRAADMQRAGFNPMLAAGSPAGNSSPMRQDPVKNQFGDVVQAVQDSVLKGVQAGKGLSETSGQNLSNELAGAVLQAKKTIARVDAANASLGLYAKSDDAVRKGLTDFQLQGEYSRHLKELSEALRAQLKREGYSSNTAGFEAAIKEFEAKWAKEEDEMGKGRAEGLGAWTSAGGKLVPGASLLIGPRKPK